MPRAVTIFEELLAAAREAAEPMQRSVDGQIEHWVRMGRLVDRALRGEQGQQLQAGPVPKLSEVIASVNEPSGRARLQAVLDAKPFPHFRQVPGDVRLFVKIDEDGTKTTGRIVGREFVPVEQQEDQTSDAKA